MSYSSMREIKLCLLGDAGVGKSSLVLRFVADRFEAKQNATIGASFMSKTIILQDKAYKYQIWDTAGQERYKALAPMYYRGAGAAIVVYDITVDNSLQAAKTWVKELRQQGPGNIIIAIAGNKSDLKDQREIPTETGKAYADSIGAVFTETSALTAENVDFLFAEISRRLPPENVPSYPYSSGFRHNVQEGQEVKRCCGGGNPAPTS